jgi:transposase
MPSAALTVSDEDRSTLTTWIRSSTVSAGHAERAGIVLACAEGSGTSEAARRLGVSRPTVIKWRDRFAEHGMAGLDDEPRSGRPKTIDDAAIIAATLDPPPERLGVTHWSTRLLARHLGVGDATVARAWRRYHVQPWRRETFKFSTDPELEAKVRDVVGLYLDPPEKAIVLCVDGEEPNPGARPDRTHPAPAAGHPGAGNPRLRPQWHDHAVRALELATGRVTDRCYDRHGKAEFLDFLKRVARAYPAQELHVVLDNYHTHKHAGIQEWLAKHPRTILHFTPTSGSWLNLVEVFFGIITRQAIRRGSYASVPELVTAIRTFIDGWNERCHSFTWTKPARDPAARP